MSSNPPATVIKCILIGDSGVGKSCLLKGFMGDSFDNMYTSTIGIDFEIKSINIDGRSVHLQIWDTAGQERFRTVTTSYYRSGDAILLAFDTTEASTFKSLDVWYTDIQSYARPDIDTVLVGTKADCAERRQVSAEAAQTWADARGLTYVETSARTSQNVERVFLLLAAKALARADAAGTAGTHSDPAASVDLTGGVKEEEERTGGCC